MASGRVTGLKEQVRNPNRVSVYLEGRYAFSLHAEVAANLREGTFLTPSEVETLRYKDALAQVYQKALRLLSFRQRSRKEIHQRLERKGVAAEVIEQVVDRLSKNGLLDDLAFSSWWVENREGFRPRSRAMLRYELLRQGVEEEIVAQALDGVDERTSARRAAEKRLPGLAHLGEEEMRKKLSNFLLRRGFSYALAREVVGDVLQQRKS